MKHAGRPEHPRLSLCGLPRAPRWRHDGTRVDVNWPEISDTPTCKKCIHLGGWAYWRDAQLKRGP